MASDPSSFWHRVGYALEQARQLPATGTKRLTSFAKRDTPDGSDDSAAEAESPEDAAGDDGGFRIGELSADHLVTTGVVALATKALDAWRPPTRTRVAAVVRAGAAGAAAALLVELVRPLLRGDVGRPELGAETPERLLAGASQGLVYGAVLEPWLPGPPLLKGALFGSAEYALDPAGGITKLLGGRSPLGRVPFVLKFLEQMDSEDRGFTEHLAFGVAVGLLYGVSRSSSGITEDD